MALNNIIQFLNQNKNKPVRVHIPDRSCIQGKLIPTNSSLVWKVDAGTYVTVQFMDADIMEWDITCNDLIPDIYLKRQ